jgi:signal peptidase I
MIGSVERYSPAANRRRVGSLWRRALRILLIVLVLYLAVTRFLVSSYRIESVSMEPALNPADRVIVSEIPYGPRVPFTTHRLPGQGAPARGDLVVVQPPFVTEPSLIARIFEPLVGFVTLQKASLVRDIYGGRVSSYMVKRVVGVPGDTLRLARFSLLVRPRGAAAFVSEQELSPARYQVATSLDAKGWSSTFPFSGNSGEIRLADDQYFVLGDNRPDSSDSRSWGPVRLERIVGKVVYRYWPPGSLGTP